MKMFALNFLLLAEVMNMPLPNRLLSIDAYRAVVMLLMIFVNDTWTLIAIPKWIDHLPAEADGPGLADVVFPAFLFIVGLSIPLAIQGRLKRGDTRWQITGHVAVRSLALILMGVFHVNLGDYADTVLLPKWVWQIAITLGFFLVWMDYANPKSIKAKVAQRDRDGRAAATRIRLLGLLGMKYFLRTGFIGVAKSLVYALVIITITGLLEKQRIRLKL